MIFNRFPLCECVLRCVVCSLTALTLCTNEFAFYYFLLFLIFLRYLNACSLVPWTRYSQIFFPQLCSTIPTCLQLQSFPYLHSTIVLSDQDPLHTEVTSICMCLPVAVSLSTFVCVLYAHLFADIFHRHRGREGVGSWLLRVCGIGSFVFPSNIFHSSSFQFTKNVHSFARTICIRCEFVMCCCSHRCDGFWVLICCCCCCCSWYFICLSSAFALFLLYLWVITHT